MLIQGDQVSDDSDFQEDSINGSTVLINKSSAQQQTSSELDDPLEQDENDVPSSPLENDDVNQQDSAEILQQDLSSLAMNMISGSNVQRSEGQHTSKPSDQIQDKELNDDLTSSTLSTNSSSRDFGKNMNLLSSGDSHQDKQRYEDASKSRTSESFSDEETNNDSLKSDQDTFPKKSNNGSSIAGKNFKNEKIDPKENVRKALKNHKHYSIDSNSQIEPNKDLAECITGLYRLLDLCEVDGSNYHVNIFKDHLKKLCNDIVPSSFKSISEVNYTKLNSISLRLIGCYGNHTLIAKFLLNKKIINQQIHDLLVGSQSSLRPGIYLLVVNSDLGLVIHWPEIGCYEENASSQLKNNMINLHRYLTKLTDYQLCLMNDKDLECFNWNLDNSDLESDEENYEFEIEESQKECDDVRIYSGFKMNLSQKIKTEMDDITQYDVPLCPLVVESTAYQSFITRKLAKKLNKSSLTSSSDSFSTELHNVLKGRSLCINLKSMNIKQLELLIKNGFEAESELLEQYYSKMDAAKSRMEEKIEQIKETMREDAGIITRMGWKYYSIFEGLFNDSVQENNTVSEEEMNRIQSKYPEVKDMIKQIRINSPAWVKLKQRYALAHLTINAIYKLLENSPEVVTEHAIREFYSMFVDEETDTHKLVEKYEKRSQEFFSIEHEKPTFDKSRINQTDEHSKRISQTKSDSVFVRDLTNSQFFGKSKNIKQNVLRTFSDEYQNWIKENFPNSVRDIVPTFSYNKNLVDEINEKFSQEKEEIEKREFERICERLEQKFNKGPLRLNILNITEVDTETFSLTYELETNQLQITIYETSLEESDIFQIQDDEFYIPHPVLSSHYYTGQYCVDFQIDPTIYEFRKISQFENRKFLLILYNRKLRQIEIFFDTAQRFPRIFKRSDSIKPFKTFHIDKKFLIAINEPKELIAILDTSKIVLNVFTFNEDKTNLYARNQDIQLKQWYNNTTPRLQYFLFIKNTEELCLVEKGGKAQIFNLINLLSRPVYCDFPPNTVNVLSSPNGSCIIAFVKEKIANDNTGETLSDKGDDVKEICAHVYFCTDFGSSVKKVLKLPTNFQSPEFLQFTCINELQTHLMSLDSQNGYFNSVIVKITLKKTQYKFQERVQKSFGRVRLNLSHKNANYISVKGRGTHFEKSVQKGQNIVIMGEKYNVIKVLSDTKLRVSGNFKPTNGSDKWMKFDIEPIETKINGLIDVYRTMFERYPIENCIDSEQNRPLNLKVVLDISDDEIEEYSEKFKDYISDMFENLKRSTKKPTSILKKFSTSVITFQELDIENERFLRKYSSEYELGEWIIKLCCLIPIQIAVVRNNLFQPLRINDDQIEFEEEYGRHIESIASNITFEWYEGIFNHFGNKKVKVISCMDEQPYEKSFMLNHLVGTSFDGTSRFTEGVWMSLVNTKKCIYVVLDFEGLGRTPQEDLFLTLFNTLVSNLILFKNQFSTNKNMLSMFRRFQDCAMLFESGSKVVQNSSSAKLCIIIKDIPKVNKENIVTEFKSKFSQLVSEEGKYNFISRMYKGGLDIIPWSTFNDAAWFKSLLNINKKLVRQEAKHDNARTFLQNTKVIMAKLKICDWSSLDDTFIQIRLMILKRLLLTVISFGLEQIDPVTELMNHDTGELIEDPAINLPDISHKFEKTVELLPDSHIRLFDEHESFAQLSGVLRDYFETNIQSRKELFDDSKWFASFDRFIKYIVDRRILRVWEWYTQNTAKFPKENSIVVNGKYELEQITTKFTLLWTLCGLTCQSCGLKCIQNRDHNGDHDCLTDHNCHFPCDDADHDDELIPKCIYKAGHKGKHICDKTNHICGKKCHLVGKRNCQKFCSKEIGHDGEHLCQSTTHYCEKDCSLSTYTQKGNYTCPNKCIIPYNVEHDSHRCENETCPIQCPIPECQRSCQSNDHLHSYSDLQVNHFCGNEHPCQKLCEEAGVCKVTTVPKRQITFAKYIQNDERLKCNKKVPPNEFEHTGKHTHGDGFHFCDTKCPFCGYFCTLPYGHTQVHETRHGNMSQNWFTDDTDDDVLEYSGHRLGDQETIILCSLHCKDLGRHYHTDYCHSEENCKLGNQKRDIQHVEEPAQQYSDRPKDHISHKLFWERTGFRDPYSVYEQQEFVKCNHKCTDHDQKQNSSLGEVQESTGVSYCELPLFHAPLDPNSNPPNDYGHISLDGHYFNCE